MLYPEAGGSSSFARHAFNELVSFGAAWAQLLNYMITIAISAFFVPHYLSIFWGPLRENPWDVVGGALVIVLLVGLNVVGIKEAAGLNIFLAVVDFATQLLLVIIGFVLIFSPSILADNVHWGVAPTWSSFFLAIPVAMIAYTGIETISNLSEEARDPPARHPAVDPARRGRRLRDLPHAAADRALRAPRDAWWTASTRRSSACRRRRAASRTTRCSAWSRTSACTASRWMRSRSTSASSPPRSCSSPRTPGVIGASRITYAMASYRQLPEVFRRLHPRFKTPWLALVVFAGTASIAVILPGQTNFLGTMYAFGAMLSFTIAHAAIVALRVRLRDDEIVYRARPNLRFRGVDWPLFALLGGLGTAVAWLVVVVQEASTRWVGLGWLAIGFAGYAVYRRRVRSGSR